VTRSPNPECCGSRRVRPAPSLARVVGGVVVTVVAVALVTGAVPLPAAVTGPPTGLLAAPPACAAPAADGSMSVAVAVDPGGVAGMTGGPATMCVTVPVGASGAEVLAARARALGRPMPRYNSAGLLCAIDGQPATGCGERVDGSYRYWAYFLGTGGWTYAGTGPALRRANAATLEGWRFVAGAGNASDPPPRTTASPTVVCPPPPPPTTAAPVVPAPAPTTVAPTPGPGGGSGMGGPGSRGDATVGDPSGTARGLGADGGPSAGGGSAGEGTGPSAGTGDVVAPGGVGDAAGEDADDRRSDPGDTGGRDPDQLAGAPVADTSAGGPPAGAFVVAALVALLGAGAVVQVRRRGAG